MKRIMQSLLIIICFVIVMPTHGFAASSSTYDLDELNMSIDIPDDYVVFTRDINSNDPNLSAYGLTKDNMSSLMESGNIYLNAWDKDVNFEIIVTMIDSSLGDFNQFSDTTLSAFASSFESEYKNMGITYLKSEKYQHEQAKFIKIYINQPNNGSTVYGLQYYTVYGSKAINVTIQSYSGKIDSAKEATLKTIVDSVFFWNEPAKTAIPKESDPFKYSDSKTGASFTVPANWTEGTLTEEREYIDAKFTSNFEEGLSIIYGSNDVWSEFSAGDKVGLTRADIDNSIITIADIAEMLGTAANNVTTIKCGGKEYYKAEVTSKQSAYGLNISVTITYLYHVENGYIYSFQFSGPSGSEYYGDFETLLNSVNYPAIATSSLNAAATNGTETASIDTSGAWITSLLIGLLITIVIHPLPIYIYRHAIRKTPVEPKRAKIITILDAIIVFIIMCLITYMTDGNKISTTAVLLWSYVSYLILTTGYQKTFTEPGIQVPINNKNANIPENLTSASKVTICSDEAEIISSTIDSPVETVATGPAEGINEHIDGTPINKDATDNETPAENTEIEPPPPEIFFCHKCGTKLPSDSDFCYKCGTKVITGEVE